MPDVRPKKSLGQHFLHDAGTIRRIVEALKAPPGAPVVEIGPGTGALTGPLLERYPDLTALEIDPEAIAHLKTAYPSLDLRPADVLEADWPALAAERGAPLWVVGNLPYYITSPILFSLLEARGSLERAVVMMQLEVAERIVADPGSKTYGILSVLTQLWARPKLLFKVSRGVFTPPPKVQSAVLALDFDQTEPDVDPEALRTVVRTAFGQRRKMLRNSLKGLVGEGLGLPDDLATRRPESLDPAAFVALAQRWRASG